MIDKKQYALDNMDAFKKYINKKKGIFKKRFIGHEGLSTFLAIGILNKTELS